MLYIVSLYCFDSNITHLNFHSWHYGHYIPTQLFGTSPFLSASGNPSMGSGHLEYSILFG